MGGQSSNTKGDRTEREFRQAIESVGFVPMKAPASGSGGKQALPDCVAGCPVTTEDSRIGERFALVYAVEIKSSSGDPIYIEGEEIDKLREFADGFGARPRIAVKFDVKRGDPAWGEDASGFYLFEPSELYTTDSGNYRVKKETALREGTPVEAL